MLIKSLISRKTKNTIKYELTKNNHIYDSYKGKKKVIVCLGADYGNLGDVAITFAQMNFLKRTFKEREILEFPISRTYLDMKSLEAVVTKEDIITLVGGGNTSERYADIEECRQFVFQKFRHNIIIAFPQSVELEKASSKFIRSMQRTYSVPEHLYIMAREKKSYDAYKHYLPGVSVELFPDIVLSMNVLDSREKREYITLSLRSDKEKSLTDSEKTVLRNVVNKCGLNVVEKDTQVCDCFDFSQTSRKELLQAQLVQYQKSRIVITDRLHGMIMAYITNTPCIVFSCDNPKIRGCYDWVASSNQTIFLDKFTEKSFRDALDILLNVSPHVNNPVDFKGLENYITMIAEKETT